MAALVDPAAAEGMYRLNMAVVKALTPLLVELVMQEADRSQRDELLQYGVGRMLDEQGDVEQALGFYRRSLRIVEHNTHVGDIRSAAVINSIGGVYRQQRMYEKALEFCSRALKIVEQTNGKEHVSTASPLSSIGMIYKDQEQYGKALEFYLRR